MIEIRQARFDDAPAIRDIFEASYGDEYIYAEFYDDEAIRKLIYGDDTLMLVAEESGRVLGTASVLMDSGAYADLVGEFGRLVVHPEARNRGIGTMLMRGRLQRVQDRLLMAFMEARVAAPYSVSIARKAGFAVVGYGPMKLHYGARREDTALLVRHFGDGLALRRNHPRVIPEAYRLATRALRNVGLEPDVVVDETAAAYPAGGDFRLRSFSAEGYSELLRIERGRLRQREVYGPLRLHYGLFRIRAAKSSYLIAMEDGDVAGAVGYTHDRQEGFVRVFEVICRSERAIRYLLAELERRCIADGDVAVIEIDVGAGSVRMQRTLVECGYVPVAYLPAMVFHEVERIDIVKMQRLLTPLHGFDPDVEEQAMEMAACVLRDFRRREVLPQIAEAVDELPLFAGLTGEQVRRLASVWQQESFAAGEVVFRPGDEGDRMWLLLEGTAEVSLGDEGRTVGRVESGECLGENALLSGQPHTAGARTLEAVTAGVITKGRLVDLIRRRPDIGMVLYRNLAVGLGDKLRRADRALETEGRPRVEEEA